MSELDPPIEAPNSAPVNPFERFAVNGRGRDFVVGDIHGMFPHLRALLGQLGFDGLSDRLFSVGDLIDRGPESKEAVIWLEYPWFHAVRGNHEQFVLDSDDPEQLDVWMRYNGGGWWVTLTDEERATTKTRFARLPLAIEVETAKGVVGIVHADVPPIITWDRFLALLEAGDRDAAYYAMWSRHRIQGGCSSSLVMGRVERVYCGHTPIRNVLDMGNVYFIDTGAVYCQEGYAEARLSIVEIHPDLHQVHAINTNDPY